ncbi:MAG: sulfatase-like hydrolase/transferase [Planctomycetaceae bacterium]
MIHFLFIRHDGCRRLFLHHLLRGSTTLAVLIAVAVIPQFISARQLRADQPQRPNVVLIMADDMGYECVGANGGTSYATPNLDALAARGARFTNCHSQPLCTPTRSQLMTGMYNNRNYIRFGLLAPKAYTIGHMFRDAGYRTYIAGKWQLEGGPEGPNHFGFEGYTLWQTTRRPPRYPNPGLEIDGKEVDYTMGEYGPELVCSALLKFIRDHKNEPFFAYYPMILPHSPHVPTPESPDWDPTVMGPEKGGGKNKHFAEMVAYVDKNVGRIVSTLNQEGLSDNTLILFLGDNGTNQAITSRMGKESIQGGKGKTKDNGTHVPLIVAGPGISPTIREDLVDTTDFLPTLAEAIGVKPPAGIRFDGHSFLEAAKGTGKSSREWIYCWYERGGNREKASRHARTARYKLYLTGEMFDVIADPNETTPLPNDQQAELRKQLTTVLDQMESATLNPVEEGK